MRICRKKRFNVFRLCCELDGSVFDNKIYYFWSFDLHKQNNNEFQSNYSSNFVKQREISKKWNLNIHALCCHSCANDARHITCALSFCLKLPKITYTGAPIVVHPLSSTCTVVCVCTWFTRHLWTCEIARAILTYLSDYLQVQVVYTHVYDLQIMPNDAAKWFFLKWCASCRHAGMLHRLDSLMDANLGPWQKQ